MIFNNYSKIGEFWKKENLLKANSELVIAKKIINMKKKCLEKVKNKEWTEEEYNKFTMVVRKMTVNRFQVFYDFGMLYLDLNNEECREEIDFLNNSGKIYTTTKSNSFHELMAASISDFSIRIANMSKLDILKEERDLPKRFNNKIKYYQDLLEQLSDYNSDYTKMIRELFCEFVNDTVKNQKLKEKILEMEETVISSKIRIIRKCLEDANNSLENNKKILNNDNDFVIKQLRLKEQRRRS